jgi:hypothetical protein
MRKTLSALTVLAWLATATVALGAERWVHVRVNENGENGERVRVNIPLSLAEKILPTINADKLHNGKVRVDDRDFHDVDLRALLEAVRTAQDNEYVTVESKHENVRVAKSGGFMLIKVREMPHATKKDAKETPKVHTVDVKIPFAVVNALLSGDKDELDLLAGLRALGQYDNLELVTVNDEDSSVRIWIDTQNTAE